MKPISIKTKVTLIATASFLALLALVTAIQMYSVKADISAVVGDQHYTLVSRVAEEIDQKLEADRQLIAIVSQSISAELIADLDELQKNLDRRAILRSVFDSIFVISAKGYVLVDSPAEGRRGIDISEQENFRQTLATRKPYISQPFLGKTSRKPVVTISAPIFNKRGEIVGLLTGTLNLLKPNVLGSIGNARIGQTGSFALVGRDRTIVVSRDKDRIMTAGPSPGISPYFDHATAGQEGWEEGTNSRGLNAIFSYKPLQAAPWVLAAALPVAEAYAPVLLAQKRTPLGVFVSDTAGNCTYLNDTHRKICGVNSEHALGLDWRTGIHPDDREAADAAWDQAVRDKADFDADLRYLRPNGTVIWAHVRASAFGDGERALGHVGTAQDITERVRHTEQLEIMAHHDVLTRLPNRALFMDRLEQVMLRCVRGHHLTALMYLDIDRFKWINDTFGHAEGDALLTGFAGRLRRSVRASDTVARLGGDEFVILMEDLHRPEDAYNVAQKIIDAMQVEYPIGTRLLRVTTSIGVAFANGAEATGDGLLKRADAALYDAKRAGRNMFNVAPPFLAEVRAGMVTGKAAMPPDRSASARA